mgnify:CR=1 FL=1
MVGVTGSVGKTSTKDLIAAALGATRTVTANLRSFNNEQGLPITILNAVDHTEALVVEKGMRGFGEIARLCAVSAPTSGIDGVARAKRELVEALTADGVAVLNADDERVVAMARHTEAQVITYGAAGEVRVVGLVLDELARARFRIETPGGVGDVRLAISGRHMASNAAAAIAVAGVIEGSVDHAIAALVDAPVSGMRMEVRRTRTGAIVVNDAYNANPDSMRAALEALAGIDAGRRVAILGAMGELDDPAAGHRLVADLARDLRIVVVVMGTDR